MVVMGIADGLVRQYDLDARTKRVVDNLNVYVVPVVNPDGYVQTWSGNRMQRRNMHPGCNVDLNRNYATAFGQRVTNSCSSDTNSGPMPFSEPETQAIRKLAESQARLRFYVDYHSNANQVMIPYAYTQTEPPGYAKNKAWGELLGKEAMVPARPGFAVAQGQGGGALDWFREVYTESLVVELPGRGFDPPSNGVNANVELEWAGWIAVADAVATENPAPGGPTPIDAGPMGGGADAGSSSDGGTGQEGSAGAAGSGGGAGSGGEAGGGGEAGRGGEGGAPHGGGASGDAQGKSGHAGDLAGGCACRMATTRTSLPGVLAIGSVWLAWRRRRRPSRVASGV
jgi:hypothetical protein